MSGSGTKRQAPEDPEPEEIQETKKKISKLEETNMVIANPAFPFINQNILFGLDHKSQMSFRQNIPFSRSIYDSSNCCVQMLCLITSNILAISC